MHRIVLTAIVVSIKMYDDVYDLNQFYAEVGAISVQELNILESTFLRKMDWNLLIPEHTMKFLRS